MPVPPQVILAAGEATKHAVRIVSQRLEHHHHQSMTKLKAAVTEMLMTGVTAVQMTMMQQQCIFLLNEMAKDAALFRSQIQKYDNAFLATADAADKSMLRQSIRQATDQLNKVREAGQLLQSTTATFLLEAGRIITDFAGKNISVPLPPQLSDDFNVIDVQ